MLVLTRRPGEAIVIDGAISVTVLAVKGDRVRIGHVEGQPVGEQPRGRGDGEVSARHRL